MGGLPLRRQGLQAGKEKKWEEKGGNEVLLKNLSEGLAAKSKGCPLELAL